jgi:uncharacterized protein
MGEERKYAFSWKLLGDLELGRPSLGNTTRLEVYRLMQFTLRDVIEQEFGSEVADRVLYEAGRLAGTEFYRNVLPEGLDYAEFVRQLEQVLKEMGIGILRIEMADLERGRWILVISEDLECSGRPDLGFGAGTYDEGFVAGLFESLTGKRLNVREVDCWCTGKRTCRFMAETVE